MIKISKRLEAIASMISPGLVVCDVGTDHGYIPIYMVQSGKTPSALAMDLRKGPLSNAKEHIAAAGLSDKIETRLSDGIENLEMGEADCVVIAGMGGELVLHIMKAYPEKCNSVKELILQPQSEIEKVRRYLRRNHFEIIDEDMVIEDGKYYPMMKVIPNVDSAIWKKLTPATVTVCDLYGPLLIKNGNPTLRKYLVKENKQLRSILTQLNEKEQTETVTKRITEVEKQLKKNEAAYSVMGEIKNAGLSD